MFGIRSEWQSIEIKSYSFTVLTFESISNTQINPNSDVIWSDVKSFMIKINCLISLTQMCQCSTYFIHKKIVGWIKWKSFIEHIDCHIVLSFNKEKNGHRTINVRIIQSFSNCVLKYMNEILVHLFYVLNFEGNLILNVFWNNIWIELNVFILWIEEKPLLKIMHSFDFIKSVGAWYTQRKETVEILWVSFETIHETCNRLKILIILL